MTSKSETTDSLMVEWAEKNSTINKYGSKEYSEFVCHNMNMFDVRVRLHREAKDEWNCEWVSPYGFVPEAGCPVHD